MRQHLLRVFGLAISFLWIWPSLASARQGIANEERAAGDLTQKEGQKPCFETRGTETGKEREASALADLGQQHQAWLTEDVVYIITPEERCEFLHLETGDERDQFVEQFWLRRSSNPDSLDNDFKEEHYRRILFANEKFSTEIPGWNTDRGHVYIEFGPPDAIESHIRRESTEVPPEKEFEGFPWERWHYRYLEGFGANVDLDFVDVAGAGNYRLAMDAGGRAALFAPFWRLVFDDRGMASPKKLDRGRSVGSATADGEQITIYAGPMRSPQIRYKDLEAIVTSGIVRDQVHFTHEVQYLRATHASTVARIIVDIPDDELSTDKTSDKSAAKYEIFARVSRPSGWVVATIERSGQADEGVGPKQPDPNREAMVALEPGTYELAIVVKDVNSGRVGVMRVPLYVPRYEDQKMTKD